MSLEPVGTWFSVFATWCWLAQRPTGTSDTWTAHQPLLSLLTLVAIQTDRASQCCRAEVALVALWTLRSIRGVCAIESSEPNFSLRPLGTSQSIRTSASCVTWQTHTAGSSLVSVEATCALRPLITLGTPGAI
jgi:hypothetical protein